MLLGVPDFLYNPLGSRRACVHNLPFTRISIHAFDFEMTLVRCKLVTIVWLKDIAVHCICTCNDIFYGIYITNMLATGSTIVIVGIQHFTIIAKQLDAKYIYFVISSVISEINNNIFCFLVTLGLDLDIESLATHSSVPKTSKGDLIFHSIRISCHFIAPVFTSAVV